MRAGDAWLWFFLVWCLPFTSVVHTFDVITLAMMAVPVLGAAWVFYSLIRVRKLLAEASARALETYN